MKRRNKDYLYSAHAKRAKIVQNGRFIVTQPNAYQLMNRPGQIAPRRTYNSLVPMRTGGYTPNTQERKVADILTADYPCYTTASIALLALPRVGADFNARVGRKVTLKSFYIRGSVQTVQSTATGTVYTMPAQMVRMICFCDLQPNGALPLVTDLLNEATPQSQLNLNNRDRFTIYTDKEFSLDPASFYNSTNGNYAASQNNQIKLIKKFKSINLEMIFNAGSTGNITDITSGALYMLWIGSAPSAAAGAVAKVSTRVRYNDN